MISAEDRLAVLEMVARYYQAFDKGRADEYAALWTADGELSGFGQPFRGHDALKALCAGSFQQSGGLWRHHFSNAVVERTQEDRVQVQGLALVSRGGENPGLQMIVEARFDVAREAGQWKVAGVHLDVVH